jgi:MFS transporter, DHA1 family, multidrug resistance protein
VCGCWSQQPHFLFDAPGNGYASDSIALPPQTESSPIKRKQHGKLPDAAIIVLLGALSLISPFAVDMYLPAFSHVATHFHTNTAAISLSLSSYFIGFALGQVLYGPLLDRFGRKPPLVAGLLLYIVASFGCVHPQDLKWLIGLRFVQALGGCVAQVSAVAMVRDFFPPQQSARIFSLVFLIIGVSPLLAPTIGSFVMIWLGWQWIFVLLALVAATILIVVLLLLPEPHTPDPAISLHPGHLLKIYLYVWKQPQFCTYALAGAFSFSGLFSYVAGSPILFMDRFHVSNDGRNRPQKAMKIVPPLSYRQQSGGVDRRCKTLEQLRPYVSLTLERIG